MALRVILILSVEFKNSILKLLAQNSNINHPISIYATGNLEAKFDEQNVLLKLFSSENEALENFKLDQNYVTHPSTCMAFGISRHQAKSLNCEFVTTSIPTCLVLENADFHSCSELMAKYLRGLSQQLEEFSPLNVVVMESYEDQFLESLENHLSKSALHTKCLSTIQYDGVKSSLSDFKGVLIVRKSHLKSSLIVKEKNLFQIVNIISARTVAEAITMAKNMPCKRDLFLWTESVSLIFSVWNNLPFSNAIVNSFESMRTYSNTTNFIRDKIENLVSPVQQTAMKFLYKLALKSAAKSMSSGNLSEKLFDKNLIDLPNRLLNWCDLQPNYYTLSKIVPEEKLNVMIVLNEASDLDYVLMALVACKWQSVFIASRDQMIRENEFIDKQQIQLTEFDDVIRNCDVIFSSDGLAPVSLKKSVKCIGDMRGLKLANVLAKETGLMKHIEISTSYVSC